MPFIRVTTNVNLNSTKEEEIRQSLGNAVEKYLGKDPVRMMTAIEGGVHMRRGLDSREDAPVAFTECKFFGGGSPEAFREFDAEVKKSLSSVLGTAAPDLYIKYEVINGWDEPARVFKI